MNLLKQFELKQLMSRWLDTTGGHRPKDSVVSVMLEEVKTVFSLYTSKDNGIPKEKSAEAAEQIGTMIGSLLGTGASDVPEVLLLREIQHLAQAIQKNTCND